MFGQAYNTYPGGAPPPGYPQPTMGMPMGSPQPPPPQAYSYSQQHLSAYQQWQQPSQYYGQYGTYIQSNVFSVQAHQAFQYNSVNDLQQIFYAEMQKNPENTRRNAIQAEDLVNILNNTPSIRNYFRINWNRELCSIMIAMLDRSKDGFMQWEEFLELQQCLVAWHNVFCQHDTDRSGFIESSELIRVIMSFGYKISPQTLETILKRYSRVVAGGRCLIAFDDFVSLCVRLRAFTDAFRRRDSMVNGCETGRTVFEYDDFLRCVMCL
ncbi:grancalcin-like [Gigantopelta aegis]|uniref:grancalcin-like n=1 Tax=Gigantopelta aegis TaxID=1735272 RepID=UPI001B88B7B4|nr:grancalcin-like [Gigantopelta aegis]